MNQNAALRRSLGCMGVAGILFAVAAGAQTPAPAAAPAASTPSSAVATNTQDYSQGFRTFMRMGLPDTSKARYVKLDQYGGMPDMMMHRLYELQLSGNAWLLSEGSDGTGSLVTSVGRQVDLLSQKAAMKRQQAEAMSNAMAQASSKKQGGGKTTVSMGMTFGSDWSQTGNWTPTDLSRDLAKATAFLDRKIKAKSSGAREMRYDSFLQSDEPAGVLFLMAAFAWQNGKVQEANLLVSRLFTLVGDSRKVIVGALNVMADGQLAGAMDAFRKTGDWNAYHAAVAGLLKRFPAGWRQAGAVKLLAGRLESRAAMTEPPAVTGEGLSAEDLKLAAALATATNAAGMRGWTGELWVLPPAKGMRGMKDDSAVGRLKARGLKSVPLLIALVSDETLCPLRRNDIGMATHYTSYSMNDTRPEEERTRTYYNQMDRPLTRGEIARALLAPLCPRDENARHDDADTAPEEVAESARQAYATLKALPPAALARHFLEHGDSNQKRAAVTHMMQNDFETNAPAIEAYLLNPPQEGRFSMGMGADSGLAQQYVQKRGEKAAEFVEKYAELRKKIELPAGMADNADYVKQMEKQAEREIKALRAMVKKQDLSEVVTDLTRGGKAGDSAMMAYTVIARQPPAKAAPALLAAAVQTTNVEARARILQMMTMVRYSGMQDSVQEEAAEAATPEAMEAIMKKLAEKNRLSIGTNAVQWKVLLADTRAVPGARMYSGGGYEWTIADLAATDIEMLYGATSPMERYARGGSIEQLRPDVATKVNRARALARLEGKTEEQLPKMPSADDVTDERRKAIDAAVLKAAPAEMEAFLDTLTDPESLYLAEAAGENEAITKALAPLSRRIASVKTAPGLPAAEAARLQKLAGAAVSTNVIAELRAVCTRQLASGTGVVVTLTSGGLGKGLRLNVAPADEAVRRMYGSGYMSMLVRQTGKRKGLVVGMLMSGRNHGNSMWLADVPAAAAPTGTVATASADADDDSEDRLDSMARSFEYQQEQFESAAEAFCKPEEALGPGSVVSFTGIMPPRAGDKKADGDGDDDNEGMVVF